MNPETSTRLKPMNAHRTRLLVMIGFLHIELTNEPKILPIPIDTPANDNNGILEANNLKPRIINVEPIVPWLNDAC